jgi:hypothetical protein
MGFVPIIIGIKKLIEKLNKEKLTRIDSNTTFKNINQKKSSTSLLSFVSVAAVIISIHRSYSFTICFNWTWIVYNHRTFYN